MKRTNITPVSGPALIPSKTLEMIVYVVIAEPGGCDGMDPTAKGGPVWAFGSRAEAEAKVGRDSRYRIAPRVVDLNKLRAGLKRRLNTVERWYLTAHGIKL